MDNILRVNHVLYVELGQTLCIIEIIAKPDIYFVFLLDDLNEILRSERVLYRLWILQFARPPDFRICK